MEETRGQKARAAREAKGLLLKEVARAVGRTEGWVSKFEKDEIDTPRGNVLARLAQVLGLPELAPAGSELELTPIPVNSSVLDEYTRQMAEIGEQIVRVVRAYDPPPTEVPFERIATGYIVLPVQDYVPASHAAPDASQVRDTLRIPEELLEGCQDPHVFYVAGDCLKPEGIRRGNHLIVDGARRSPQNGDVVVARLDGELTMKLYYRLDDRVELRPSAPGYETLVAVDGKNQLEIVGVAHAVYTTGRFVR